MQELNVHLTRYEAEPLNQCYRGLLHGVHLIGFYFFFITPDVWAQDPNVHLKNLKPSPPASAIVDRCIECGFCESNCPSRDITLTPRQRITTWREISRLRTIEDRSPAEQQRCARLLGEPAALHEYV